MKVSVEACGGAFAFWEIRGVDVGCDVGADVGASGRGDLGGELESSGVVGMEGSGVDGGGRAGGR